MGTDVKYIPPKKTVYKTATKIVCPKCGKN